MTLGVGLSIGGYFPAIRLLLLAGFIRTLVFGEHIDAKLNKIDYFLFGFTGWSILASFFHISGPGSGPFFTFGLIASIFLTYYLVRVSCESLEDIVDLIKLLSLLMIPVALEMLFEKSTRTNLFGALLGGDSTVLIREGKLRAQGPFRHPILAGTVAASCIPLFAALWARHRKHATIGLICAAVMIFASNSSGPLLTAMITFAGIALYRFKWLLRWLLAGAACCYIILEIFGSKPAYYWLLTRMDLTGSSTGRYRADLITTSINHFWEWCLWGTDYTIHWIPSGMGSHISPTQIDITNYFLYFGVLAGFPAFALLVGCSVFAFLYVGRILRETDAAESGDSFLPWCLGTSLAAHVASSISVAYFDQSMVFFWLVIALISSVYSIPKNINYNDMQRDPEQPLDDPPTSWLTPNRPLTNKFPFSEK